MAAGTPTISFPARCAVAVVCGKNLISQVYPASVPIEGYIDGVVDLINEDLKRRGAPGLETSAAYELQRANGTRLDVTKSLDELGVEDGATLVLAPASEGDSFEPQYESLSTGLARLGREMFPPVTAMTASGTALAILAMIAVTITCLTASIRLETQSWLPALAAAGPGCLIGAGALVARRWWPDRPDLIAGLGWPVVPLLAVGVAAAAPGQLGAAHVFIAALVGLVLSLWVFFATQLHLTVVSAAVTLVAAVGAVAAVVMLLRPSQQSIGIGVLLGLLVLLAAAPTIALWAARIRPPHFGSITGRDLFRRGDGMAVDAVIPVEDDLVDDGIPDCTPTGADIARAARRANAVLRGVLAAAACILPAAVWATLRPGQPYDAAAALLAGLFVLIFVSRARAFTDKRQAVALVCGAAAAVCASVTRYVADGDSHTPAMLAAGSAVLVAFAAAGLAAALLVPATRFTPLVRMVAEWLELAAIVVALPLSAWIVGVFAWVRMR